MVYEPYMTFPARVGSRTYPVGPRGAPIFGYRPALLVAVTPRIGRASRVGRRIHKIINDNLRRYYIWPQCLYGTVKKRFDLLRSLYKKEWIQLYEVDHTLLGMLTSWSWNHLLETLRRLKPLTHRKRPDLNSPDPNSVRSALRNEARVSQMRKAKQRNSRLRKRQRLAQERIPPPPPPPPVAQVIPRPPPPPPLRVAVEQRSFFSREMERNEILRRREAEYSTSSSGVPTTRQPTVADPERQEIPDVPDIRSDPAYAECIRSGECLGHPKKSVTLKCPVNWLLREEVPRLNLDPNFPWKFPPGSGGQQRDD